MAPEVAAETARAPVPLETTSLPVAGMTCAACARVIERTLTRLPGVDAAAVNYATGRASLRFDPAVVELPRIAEAVRDVGYEVIEAAPGKRAAPKRCIDSAQRQSEAREYRGLDAPLRDRGCLRRRRSSSSACRTRSSRA